MIVWLLCVLACFSLHLSCMGLSALPGLKIDYFLSHIREVFNYNLFKYFLRPFFSSSSGTPIMQILVHLMLSQRSLRLSSILFILFSLFCSFVVISTILSSRSLIRSSASVILLLIPSSKVLVSFILLFITVCLLCSSSSYLLRVSCIFSILFPVFWIIFTIIILNSFSGRLPISSSFVRSGEFLLGKKGKDYFLSLGKEEGQYYHQGSFQVQVKYKCDSLPLKWILLSPPE